LVDLLTNALPFHLLVAIKARTAKTATHLFWLVHGEILCNHTNPACVGKREVTRAEAGGLSGSRVRGTDTQPAASTPQPVSRAVPGVRSRSELELSGTLMGPFVEMLIASSELPCITVGHETPMTRRSLLECKDCQIAMI
jgi:hypothetical protein